MRVAFYCQTPGIHWDVARYLVESVNRTMPEVAVYHLTDGDCPIVDGAKGVRIHGKMPMGLRRIRHYAQLEGEWVFCDTDVIFLKDVRHVFSEPFDVALATRKGSFLEGSQYEKDFPYNFGVVFSRSPGFWRKALGGMAMLPAEMQEWEGEQWVTGKLADSGQYKAHILPRGFNYTPETIDEDLSEVSILHMKGNRKTWIPRILESSEGAIGAKPGPVSCGS